MLLGLGLALWVTGLDLGFVAGMGLGFLVLYLGRVIRVAGLGLIC